MGQGSAAFSIGAYCAGEIFSSVRCMPSAAYQQAMRPRRSYRLPGDADSDSGANAGQRECMAAGDGLAAGAPGSGEAKEKGGEDADVEFPAHDIFS